jgi:hypothetical protein
LIHCGRYSDWLIEVRFLTEARDFSFLHSGEAGSGAHPASYPMGTGALSLGVKQ